MSVINRLLYVHSLNVMYHACYGRFIVILLVFC